jgi:hypothetical protein
MPEMNASRAAGTADLIRILTDALLRYPLHGTDLGVLAALRRVFRPRISDNEEFPVSGVGAAPDESVHIFMSEKGFKLSDDDFEDFFGSPPVPVRTRYTGKFIPCGGGAVTAGDSISHSDPFSDTGTLGCIISDIAGKEFLLSCNHVIANHNDAKLGDEIWLPGRQDGGTNNDTRAVLHDFEPLRFGGVAANYMDAAVARPVPGVVTYKSIQGGVGVVGGTEEEPDHGTPVHKYGWKSGVTHANLAFKDLSLKLPYTSDKFALFVGQYGVVDPVGRPFAEGGDSGALVVNARNEAVGLLFCKASIGDVAVVNPIGPILTRFYASV